MKSSTLFFTVASLLIFFITMSVDAGVEVLTPYVGIKWTAGEAVKINWKENNNAPLLSSLNSLTITLMAGTQESQFPAGVIASNVQGSSLTASYTVPKNIGPPGSFYFLKFSQGTYLAFSGYFSIEGTSGSIPNFNPNNPGASLTTENPSSTSSSTETNTDTNSATSSSSLNSTETNTATSSKPKLSSNTDSLTPTAPSTVGKGNSGPTQSPSAKSSSNSNKLATSLSTLSLCLFVMAFYLF